MSNYKLDKNIYNTKYFELFLGISQKSQKKVVMKSLKEEYSNSLNLKRLTDEFLLLKDYNHENIIKAYEIKEISGKTYLIREYFESLLLNEFLNNQTLDLKTFLEVSIQICKALSFLHDKNIVHGNLSPSCILINQNNEVKIAGFGYASSLVDNIQNTNDINLQSNDIYKAPEQSGRIKNQINHKVDIYTLGIIFYEMLTGQTAFSSSNTLKLSHNLIAKNVPFVSSLNSEVPFVISYIIKRMMAKNQDDRYSQILSVYADLNKCLYIINNQQEIKNFEIDNIRKVFELKPSEDIYGREDEIKKIEATILNIKNNTNTLFCVCANSGIGKSTLVNHVLNKHENSFNYLVKVKLDKHKQNTPYEMLYLTLRNLTKQIISEDEKSLKIWKKKLIGLLGNDAHILIEVIPEIEFIIGKQKENKTNISTNIKARFDSLLFKFIQLFCLSKKPLCIFLDDVQWADFVTLKWLENAILNLTNVLIIVAYRDNEVTSEHPFSKVLNKLYSLDANIIQMSLNSMSKNTIKEFIDETMNMDNSKAVSEIIYQKTAGNSFFIKQYLIQLQKDNVIYYKAEDLKWYCDMERIYKLPISDNVFDVLEKRIISLPPHVQSLLNIAACIGNSFSNNLLQKVYNDNKLFEEAVSTALEEEWILKDQNSKTKEIKSYSFSHDRMQQIVYLSLDEVELKRIHLLIGFTIIEKNSILENKNLITSVNHLNKGYSLVQTDDKKEFLSDLNIEASIHAKKSGDFINALFYIKKVMELCPNLDRHKKYIEILKQRAECEHLCHNKEEALEYYNLAVNLSSSKLEKALIYELIIKLHTDNSDFQTAYNVGRTATELFDLKLPATFNKVFFITDFIKIKSKIKSKEITDLLNLPEVKDENIIMLIRILSALLKVAFQIKPELSVAISVKLVNLCLKYGNTKESVVGFMVFGVIFQGGVLCKHDLGYEYAKLSLSMLNKFNNTAQHSEVQFVCGYFATSWKKSSASTEQDWYLSYTNGLEIGDWFHSGCAAAGIIQSMFMRGVSFDKILKKIEHFEKVLISIGAKEQNGAIQSIKQTIKNLRLETNSILSYSDDSFDEESYIKSLYEYKSPHFAHYYFVNKMISLYIHKEYDEAYKISKKSKFFTGASKGTLHNTEFYFYEALILAKKISDKRFIEKTKFKLHIEKTKNKFKLWTNNCSENFLVRSKILEALLHQINNNTSAALLCLEEAIRAAKIYGQVHLQAIANSLAAQIYDELKQYRAGLVYHDDTFKSLHKWGINSYVNINKNDEIISSDNFDITTIMKAAEVIIKEQRLPNLLKILINMIIENAGAQHGVLLLQNDERLFVQANASTGNDTVNIMENIPYEKYENIVHSVVNYVLRTKETIVIDNIQNNTIFSSERSILKRDVKAVLCAPLMLHGKIKGMIYLENNVIPSVFTNDKVEILKNLSGQIVISIENALIYNNLETKVEERTRTLDIKNDELEKQNIQLQEQNNKISELNTNIIKENEERKKVEVKLQDAVAKLDLLATTDGLTNLKNRRSFDETLIKECKRLNRNDESISLIMCDVDFFKNYNDYYGHQKGDECLVNIAKVLTSCVRRETDFVGRYGGEEFVIIMPQTTKEGALEISQSIHNRLNELKFEHKKSNISDFITLSIGIADSNEMGSNCPIDLIKYADSSLYKAKKLGRNRTV